MREIIPAILEKNFAGVEARLEQVRGAAAAAPRTVQIDICDGVLTESLTWPFITPPAPGKSLNLDGQFKLLVADELEMPQWDSFEFELDLMLADPARILPDLLAIGPKRVVFHLASLADPMADMEKLDKLLPRSVEAGIAIGIDTDPSLVFPLVDAKLVSFVQCMGIRQIGLQGQPHDDAALEAVCGNLSILRAAYPDLPLSVDGGVSLDTAPQLLDAGATRLVAGSAIFSAPNAAARIGEFQKMLQ